jgi:hypothetical protein
MGYDALVHMIYWRHYSLGLGDKYVMLFLAMCLYMMTIWDSGSHLKDIDVCGFDMDTMKCQIFPLVMYVFFFHHGYNLNLSGTILLSKSTII